MRKILLAYLFCLSLLQAKALTKEYEILASALQSSGKEIWAQGDVLVFSSTYAFRADRVHYDRYSGDLSLYGNVDIMFDKKILTHLKETVFNLKTKQFKSRNFFAHDSNSQIWFAMNDAHSKNSKYYLENTELSSCNRIDPDWKITFSKGIYDKRREYISIYNPIFYVADVPLLYLPWFGFPTNKKRKSGFLKPILGFENRENLFFVLPYYIANEKNWDIELDPQLRLNRGMGLYSTLRFVDSNHSKGMVNIGLFKERKAYYEKNNLENRTHFGTEFRYESSALLTQALKNKNYHDGLLLDLIYLNDIDYINLDHKKDWANSKLVTSRANYVFYRDDDFLGIYGKYFIDTEKTSNEDTLQTLPSIQYHRFSQLLDIPYLLYSLDYKFKNNYRQKGLNAKQHELAIPLTLYKSFFNDYVIFKASENFYYSRVNYTEGNNTTENANYFSNYHRLSLSTDLTKQYPSYIHNLQVDFMLSLPSFEHRSGYFADFLPFNLEKKSLSLRLNQYYYRLDGFNFFTHRLRQIVYDDKDLYKYADFENQFIYKFSPDYIINNTLFYSHEFSRIKKLQTGITYKNPKYRLALNHTYEYNHDQRNTNFVTSNFSAKIDKNYDIFASLDYDLEDDFTKEWTLGWRMKKRCWDYMFRYKESVTPSLTSAGTESLIKRGVLLFVRFSPFGGMTYNFNQQSSLDVSHIEGLQ